MSRFKSKPAGLTTQKEVLFITIYKDMSFKEIYKNTGVRVNTALAALRLVLIKLRKITYSFNELIAP